MLRDLFIKNFAIIDNIHISFSKGLAVLTGETGAGKSIIINSLKLILGERSSIDLIKTDREYAEVEAFFDITPGSEAGKAMEAQGFNQREGLSVRRIIARNGKNKIFLNGHRTTLQMMTNITEKLISISGQHAYQTLLKPEHHLAILDQFTGLKELRNRVSECYNKMLPLIKKVHQLKEQKSREAADRELLLFQTKEITLANLSPEEETELDQERARLKNVEILFGTLGRCIERLYGSEGSIVEGLTGVGKDIERLGKIDTKLIPIAENILSAAYQTEDCVADLRSHTEILSFDPDRLEKVEERLDIIQKLKRKYGKSIEDVLCYLDKIKKKLRALQSSPERMAELEEKLFEQKKTICELSIKLSEKRKDGARRFCRRVQEELGSLEMRGTKVDILFEYTEGDPNSSNQYPNADGRVIGETGFDQVSFLISPNVGEGLKPLIDIASGGELSRIVLALKAIMADRDDIGTIFFDEVDAGIGGSVAETVGQKMKEISKYHQVVCITHLPQIASFGDHHFKISKEAGEGRTYTTIEPIDGENRINEIARMLGGVNVSPKTLDHAKEMLGW
jgi:DNA repair protein RecN (Recombination protein N)